MAENPEKMTRSAGKTRILSRAARAGSLPTVGWAALLTALGVLLVLIGAADARIVKNEDGDPDNDPRMVFGRIARAWEGGDEQALAQLVHRSGLKVTAGGNPDRSTHYSPSQAFYYFKNVFQRHRTMVFMFDKTQDASTGDRVHGMAVWKRRRPDSDRIQEVKLVCILARQDDQWRLVEINTIR